ncbi:MAG: DUF4169 family protein [Caulobacteraceae bacterium]|nr:DUF4169 family protein [Caulobacteraceae bacterium]
MSEIINFNRIKKERAKAASVLKAAENRVKFGRTRLQRELAQIELENARKKLDQAKRET